MAAPEAGRFLSEWGADVIKVESAKRPDFQRWVMGSNMNPAFASPNRNKRVLAADLGTEAGRELVQRMLPTVDVILENNATGVIDRLGLGWETVSAINPRIVMVDTQLYGDRGPWATKKGYGPSARAIGGLTWLWAHGPDAPRGVMTIHPDHLAGRLVALGALAGLHARERTGRGSRIDIAQFETVVALLGDLFAAESVTPGAAVPVGNRSAQAAPWNVYRCADDDGGVERWLAVCVPDDETWDAFVSVAPAEFNRPEWKSLEGRLAAVDALDAALSEWLRSADAGEMEGAFPGGGGPCRSAAQHERSLRAPPLCGAGLSAADGAARLRSAVDGGTRFRHVVDGRAAVRPRADAGGAHRRDLPGASRSGRRSDRGAHRSRGHRSATRLTAAARRTPGVRDHGATGS